MKYLLTTVLFSGAVAVEDAHKARKVNDALVNKKMFFPHTDKFRRKKDEETGEEVPISRSWELLENIWTRTKDLKTNITYHQKEWNDNLQAIGSAGKGGHAMTHSPQKAASPDSFAAVNPDGSIESSEEPQVRTQRSRHGGNMDLDSDNKPHMVPRGQSHTRPEANPEGAPAQTIVSGDDQREDIRNAMGSDDGSGVQVEDMN